MRSSRRRPESSAILNNIARTSDWISFRSRIRARRSGPISDMVVLTGGRIRHRHPRTFPEIPLETHRKSSSAALSITFALSPPGITSPERSPLMSAKKTGTPIELKFSARTRNVVVFPVPVAPAIRPWRLAIPGSVGRSVTLLQQAQVQQSPAYESHALFYQDRYGLFGSWMP